MALSDLPPGAYIAVALSLILVLGFFFYIFGCIHGCLDLKRRNNRMRRDGIPDLEAAKVTKSPRAREGRKQSQTEAQDTRWGVAPVANFQNGDTQYDGVDHQDERMRQRQREIWLEKPPRSLISRGNEGEDTPKRVRFGQMRSGSEDGLPHMPTLPRPVARR